eukprot:m.160847 g.160847  ORF g.160847 m.160847 type:complete len:62 (+) comp38785_c1_seq6:536-721(+)
MADIRKHFTKQVTYLVVPNRRVTSSGARQGMVDREGRSTRAVIGKIRERSHVAAGEDWSAS